jgi:hypothetical protein
MWKKGLISPISFCALRERKGVALFLKNPLSPFSLLRPLWVCEARRGEERSAHVRRKEKGERGCAFFPPPLFSQRERRALLPFGFAKQGEE